jgi:hypothetical protein
VNWRRERDRGRTFSAQSAVAGGVLMRIGAPFDRAARGNGVQRTQRDSRPTAPTEAGGGLPPHGGGSGAPPALGASRGWSKTYGGQSAGRQGCHCQASGFPMASAKSNTFCLRFSIFG